MMSEGEVNRRKKRYLAIQPLLFCLSLPWPWQIKLRGTTQRRRKSQNWLKVSNSRTGGLLSLEEEPSNN
jgi:hypothetical protein